MGVTNPDRGSGMTEYERKMLASQERQEIKATILIAYLLWFFFGLIMAHKVYIDGSAKPLILPIVIWGITIPLTLATGPFGFIPLLFLVLTLIGDLFFIPKMVRDRIKEAPAIQEKDDPQSMPWG